MFIVRWIHLLAPNQREVPWLEEDPHARWALWTWLNYVLNIWAVFCVDQDQDQDQLGQHLKCQNSVKLIHWKH